MPRPSLYADQARTPERPRCQIPLDRAHEFLTEPLPYDSSVVRTWAQHFTRTGVLFRRVDQAGKTQLYCHRVRLKFNGTRIEQWCCSSKEKEKRP